MKYFFILISLSFCCSAFSQSEVRALYLTAGAGFSFSGFNSEIGLEHTVKQHRIGIAYKTLLSESFFFSSLSHGLTVRYSRHLLDQNRWTAGAHARIMQSFGPNGSRLGEYLIGQELVYRLNDRMNINQVLAIGMYEEVINSSQFDLTTTTFGASGAVFIGLNYQLNKSEE